MRLGIRLLFGFFLITGLAAFFVLRVFMAEVKPSVREVMEDVMVDTANILAEIASDDLVNEARSDQAQGPATPVRSGMSGRFSEHVRNYARRPIDAQIWGLDKQSLDFRIYVTDVKGMVLFDSENVAVGADYSKWRDVARTLRGEYGARATREVQQDDKSSVMYVAAPISKAGKIIGVLTVAKPIATIQGFIDRAERKILWSGFILLFLSVAIGVVVTLWVVVSVRKLRAYAIAVGKGMKPQVPKVSGELGELAEAMEAMRLQLDGHVYMEAYVRALTHELKSPLAAIRGAGELLQEELPEPSRQEFAAVVLDQTSRLQALVDQMLQLTKLEQNQAQLRLETISVPEFLNQFVTPNQASAVAGQVRIQIGGATEPKAFKLIADRGLLNLAVSNLLANACAFAPPESCVTLEVGEGWLAVRDTGPGVETYALARLGRRFYSTARPGGQSKGSGLGLAIVQQIMKLHEGEMRVQNAQPGLRVKLLFSIKA